VAGIAALSVATGVAANTDAIAFAEPADDANLRLILRESVVPGAVRVALTREPDYFAADGLAGADDVTLVSRREGRLVGMGRLSVSDLVRNGRAQRIGYLGALRITSGTRESARMLRDGYELLRELGIGNRESGIGNRESGGAADGFFTSIATDNTRARRVLENGARFGLPTYRPLCDLVTLIAPVVGSSVRSDSPTEPELLDFLQHESSRAQLTLAWSAERLHSLSRHGITAADFRVVRQGGRIICAGAVWDQRSFRQTIVDGYSGMLDALRVPFNAVQAILRRPSLPRPGSVLAQGALLGAFAPSPDDWNTLWPVLGARAVEMGLSWLSISRDARDPELAVLRRLTRAREYHTTLYEVEWRDGPRWPDAWDHRPFRPEVGLL
jgi:hypothetical protein